MAIALDTLGSWLPVLLAPVFFPSGVIVRIISGIFITLGIAFLAPIVSLIAFDIGLWLWRLYSLSRNAFRRRQRLLREEQREQRERRQQQQQQILKRRVQQQQDLQKLREGLAKGKATATTTTAATTATETATATRRQ